MKTTIKTTVMALLMASLLFSCSKDDDNPVVENEKGYFPTQISINYFAAPSNNVTYNFSYNEYNEITKFEQVSSTNTYTSTYTYTNHLLTQMNDNGVITEFSYTSSGRLVSATIGSGTTRIFAYDAANNKYSWTSGGATSFVDFNTNNAVEAFSVYSSVFSVNVGTENDGIFKNLAFQPALSITMAYTFGLDIYMLSPSAIGGFSVGSSYTTCENTTDENGNIVSALYSEGATPVAELTIAYEEREINHL